MGVWKEEYLLGVDLIDSEHKKLFNIIDRCYELLFDELSIDKYDKIVNIITELEDYTRYHFKHEEEYMMSINYKRFFSHKVLHDEFVTKINEFDLNKIDEDQDKYIKELLDFITEWITEHILYTDKQYTV